MAKHVETDVEALTGGQSHDQDTKYNHEAKVVKELLEKGAFDEAAKRLTIDSNLRKHEFHALIGQIKLGYEEDKLTKDPDSAGKHIPDLEITNDREKGIRIAEKGKEKAIFKFDPAPEGGFLTTKDLLSRSKSAKNNPRFQKLYSACEEQYEQSAEMARKDPTLKEGRDYLSLGQMLVDKNVCTRDEYNHALRTQATMYARRAADDLSTSMPVLEKEGYFDVLMRNYPNLSKQHASSIAHFLNKTVNPEKHGELQVGDTVALLTPQQKDHLAKQLTQHFVVELGPEVKEKKNTRVVKG